MSSSRQTLLALAIAIVAAWLPVTSAAQKATKPVDLRAAVLKALDKRWKPWTLAPLTCPTGGQAGPAAPILDGDYNSDNQPDAAFAVTTDKGAFLVAAINRIEDIDLYQVDALPAGGAVSVQLRKRGTKYFRKDLPFDQYFGVDVLTVAPCAGGGDVTAYQFTGTEFRREAIVVGAKNN